MAGSLYVVGEARAHLVGGAGTEADVWAPPTDWEDAYTDDLDDGDDDLIDLTEMDDDF